MIISSVDVSIALRRELDGAEAEFVSILLPMIHDSADTYLGRALELAERTETGLPLFPDQDFIPLHHTPVRSVSEVKVDDIVWPIGTYAFERSGIRLIGPGQPLFASGVVPSSIDITYIGGLGPPISTRARSTLLLRAVRLVLKFRDDTIGTESVRVEGYAVQYMSEGWSDDEKLELDRLGRKRAVSSLQANTLPSSATVEQWGRP